MVSKRNIEYAATRNDYESEKRLKPVKSMLSKNPSGISNSSQWITCTENLGVNRMNIKDVVPNLRCEGPMVVPVRLNTGVDIAYDEYVHVYCENCKSDS